MVPKPVWIDTQAWESMDNQMRAQVAASLINLQEARTIDPALTTASQLHETDRGGPPGHPYPQRERTAKPRKDQQQ